MVNKLVKPQFPDVDLVASEVTGAAGVEFDDESWLFLREELRELIGAYLLAAAGERIAFKPSEVAVRI